MTVLIGTNSSGKSNILDALQFLGRIASGTNITAALQGDNTTSQLRGGIEWAPRKPGNEFEIYVEYFESPTTDYVYSIRCEVLASRCEVKSEQLDRIKYRVKKDGSRGRDSGRISLFRTDAVDNTSPTIIARLYNGKRGSPRQMNRSISVLFQLYGQRVLSEIQEGVRALVESLRDIFILDPIPSHMRGFSPLAERLEPDAGNIAGVLAALEGKRKTFVEQKLSDYAKKLPERDISRVYAETVGKFQTDAMLYCEEEYSSTQTHTVDARGMSDGTLRFLAILVALLTRPSGSLLVIEEVDNGLHPSRSELLLDMLSKEGQEREVDIIVTTHNPALLNAMGTKLVPFISAVHRDQNSGASVITLLEDIQDLPKLLATGPVGNITSRGLLERILKSRSEKNE